jgi:hypothetical protein
MLMTANSVFAAPVRFEQVQQVVNVKPGSANAGGFAQLRFADGDVIKVEGDDDDDKTVQPQDDDRVIVTTSTTVEEDDCNCPLPPPDCNRCFPKWAFLGLAVIPLIFIIRRDRDRHKKTPPPPMTPPQTETPTPTTTPTTTPKVTPTPEPVPEPMTILLFGTGLAGIGLAARRRLRKRDGDEDDEQNES